VTPPLLLRLRGGALGAFLVLLLAVSGCAVRAGAPASDSSWTSATDQALGSALSSLGTARLVLRNLTDGHLPSRYAAVSLRDALRVLQTESSGYLAAQPPSSRVADNATAVAAIQESITVLNQATVAGSGSAGAQHSAARAVDAEYRRVEKLQTRLVG
jgi:hypothetical protein